MTQFFDLDNEIDAALEIRRAAERALTRRLAKIAEATRQENIRTFRYWFDAEIEQDLQDALGVKFVDCDTLALPIVAQITYGDTILQVGRAWYNDGEGNGGEGWIVNERGETDFNYPLSNLRHNLLLRLGRIRSRSTQL